MNTKVKQVYQILKNIPELKPIWIKEIYNFTIEDEIQLKKLQRKEKLQKLNGKI
jgi:hypothetical protein